MESTEWRGVEMATIVADTLKNLEAHSSTDGLWLYALARALRPTITLGVIEDPALLLWMALGVDVHEGDLTVVTTPETVKTIEPPLVALAASERFHVLTTTQPNDPLPVSTLDLAFLETTHDAGQHTFDKGRMIIVPVGATLPRNDFNEVILDDRWRLLTHLERPNRYVPSPRDQAVAILLHALEPNTLVLGMNVVFDGAMKPRKSKINFSGVGGQIGFGDVLVCHPDTLNRFAPLPGAIALVLGELTEPIEAFACPLRFGDDILTVVLK